MPREVMAVLGKSKSGRQADPSLAIFATGFQACLAAPFLGFRQARKKAVRGGFGKPVPDCAPLGIRDSSVKSGDSRD